MRLITEVGEWFDRRLQRATSLGESGGAERSGTGQRCRAPYAGPAYPARNPGRRQHASLWKEFESGGDDSARRISRNVASGGTNSRSQRRA